MFFSQVITRELRVESIKIPLLGIAVLVSACAHNKQRSEVAPNVVEIPEIEVKKEDLELRPMEGKWYRNNEPFNGYAMRCYPDGSPAERTTYRDGKKEGEATKWYQDGVLKKKAFYKANKLHGEIHTWWPDGSPASALNYQNGSKDGEQMRWYPNGQISRKTNFSMGKEEGMQQAWLKNGKIYVNYESKNGRTFGLRKAKLCYELKDEIVQR
ncbi:toxin-antitoxin system YwqK family antitoxin [Poritiphilus flavus]|uniref:Toxin-antitoxin system YwqK family antitoxin n=1 Tax=Poritiphilus flavus TaxID=2697053 RepID=A0A6L9EAH7_9FLAO|nr:toxin-antitoxin system YwqK family antitoxin [Poritiphilus flavus]NAS11664.1 hypothetical protein [Poritiphilus flavus]